MKKKTCSEKIEWRERVYELRSCKVRLCDLSDHIVNIPMQRLGKTMRHNETQGNIAAFSGSKLCQIILENASADAHISSIKHTFETQ